MKKNIINLVIVVVSIFSFVRCSTDQLEPTLSTQKSVSGNVNSDSDMFGLLKGALNRMTLSGYYGRNFIVNDEVRSDNTFANGNSGRFGAQSKYEYSAGSDPGCWDDAYRVVASANIIIAVDPSSVSGNPDYIKHIQGQAYFIRALSHFDLLKDYGQQYIGGNLGVVNQKEFKASDLYLPRNTVDETKAFIYDDLQKAFDMMSDNFNGYSKQVPTKYAAKALESRVATYFQDWPRVKTASEAVINSQKYSVLDAASFVGSFSQDGSANSIFELGNSDTDNQGINGLAYIYRGDSYGDVEVMPGVQNLFEASDVRGLHGGSGGILGYEGSKLRNMGKYPELNGYDNTPVIRYEEIILNYAEALESTGGDVLTQLTKITSNRGASAYSAGTKANILLERRKELMFEGFRFDDMVRTGVSLPIKVGSTVTSTLSSNDPKGTFPIPRSEMDSNPNMVQNPGY